MPSASRYRQDEDGIAVALVALLLMGFVTALALSVNIGASLTARSRLQTMAELGAAAGGQELVSFINATYLDPARNYGNTPLATLLNDTQRGELQNRDIAKKVQAAVLDSLNRNRLPAIPELTDNDVELITPDNGDQAVDANKPITLWYPVVKNDCAGGKPPGVGRPDTVDVKVIARYNQPRLIQYGSEGIKLSAIGIYSLKICP